MAKIRRFPAILAGTALLTAAAVLVMVMGMNRGGPSGERAYAYDPGAEAEAEALQTAGGLTTKAIDLPAVQAHCRSQTDQHYDDCVTVNQVIDALAGDCANCSNLTYIYSTTTGRVVKIKLHKKGLKGHIPAEIGSLEMLEEMWLYTNELSGTIPSEMGNLANLTWLFVSDNSLSGQIPENLNNLTLDRLWLHKNSFTGCVPYNLTLTREYKVDRGLPACAPPAGDGTLTPTPTPTPTDRTPTTLDLRNLENANCSAEDLSDAFGGTYTRRSVWGPFRWERNGEGWLASLHTSWEEDGEDGDIVECLTVVYDCMASQILNDDYGMLRRWTEYDWVVMRAEKPGGDLTSSAGLGLDPSDIGDHRTFKAMLFDLGYYRQFPNRSLNGPYKKWAVAAGLFSRGEVTVMVSGWANADYPNPLTSGLVNGPYNGVVEALRLIDSRRGSWGLP